MKGTQPYASESCFLLFYPKTCFDFFLPLGAAAIALRLSYGSAQRLPRISPDAPVQYDVYTIPPGVPFSMSSYITHHDETVFPNSYAFDPSRWLNDSQVGAKPLTKYMTAFSRGTRACLGQNLAWAEFYILMANVFRKLDFELVDTEEDSVAMAREYLVSLPKDGAQGVRVRVK